MSEKAHALHLKFQPDQLIQTNIAGNYVPTKNFGAAVPNPELQAKILIGFVLEKSDLTLIAGFEAEIPVSHDSLAGYTLYLVHLDHCMSAGRLFMVPYKVVAGGNEQMTNLNVDTDHNQTIIRASTVVKYSSTPALIIVLVLRPRPRPRCRAVLLPDDGGRRWGE